MKRLLTSLTLAAAAALAFAQDDGPTFRVPQSALSAQPTVIVYGDQRFHDPENTKVADPHMRQALVARIAQEQPDAVQMSGDVPYKGTDPDDYAVYAQETSAWRTAHLRIYPALGNHELVGGAAPGLAAWWKAFPELDRRAWYSVLLGDRIALVQLDSNSDLLKDSVQLNWLREQLALLPSTVDFVLISLHHPPVADLQTHIEVDHNPRPNEIALKTFLAEIAPSFHAQFVVTAGHIHNYERNEADGITYLVSGGGGARPYYVERTSDDLYQDVSFPVFHYVKFTLVGDELRAAMFKVKDPTDTQPVWEEKDHFIVTKKK